MTGDRQDSVWPLPKLHFSVSFGDGSPEVLFQEITGLEQESQPIAYRQGNNPVFPTVKMPGLAKSGNVTLKKGIFTGDNTFWDWVKQTKMNTITRRDMTIKLLDEGSNPKMIWKLSNAFPTKIQGTDLKAEGSDIAVETIEIAHEGLTIENA